MRYFKKTLLVWIALVSGALLCLVFLPNDGPSNVALLINAIMLLTSVVCFALFLKEPRKSNKPVFFNFAIFFGLSLIAFLYSFVGVEGGILFPGNILLRFLIYQYHLALMFLLLSLSVVYVVIDSLFNDVFTYKKYVLSLIIAGGTFAYYYYPLIENPTYLATTENYVDLKSISNSVSELNAGGNLNPTVDEISGHVKLGVWRDGRQIGTLFEDQKHERVAQLVPYLNGDNKLVLLYAPLYRDNIYMNVLCVVFIFLFFGYQYKNDPPQGAYIEKIIFLFLPYCSLEILHHYAYIKSVEYSTFEDVQHIGGYLTLVNLLLLLIFFGLRLKFITSVKGEFYERELVSDAEHISRWRDAFDNLVVRHFLNPEAVHGRLFAPRTTRTKT